jgi:hypothetical protein
MKKKNITKKEFNFIKTLTDAGLTIANLMEITKRGNSTIARVKSAKDFNEYKEIIKSYNLKNKTKDEEKQVEKSVETQPANEDLTNDILIELKSQTEELRKLRGQIVGIESQISLLGNKKKWF